MIGFVESQWKNVVDYLPDSVLLSDDSVPDLVAKFVSESDKHAELPDLFHWGQTIELPKKILAEMHPGGFLKKDPFVTELEKMVKNKVAYNLSSNAGSKPQSVADVKQWISEQKRILERTTGGKYPFKMTIKDFPRSRTGLLHLTTAKNVLYLADSAMNVSRALAAAFPRLEKFDLNKTIPALVYISNSLKPGRIFGDPFTGQLSAFANIFGKDIRGVDTRMKVAYYPHQVHAQLLDETGAFRTNKGITLMRELLDFAVFHGGVVVEMKTGKIV